MTKAEYAKEIMYQIQQSRKEQKERADEAGLYESGFNDGFETAMLLALDLVVWS